MKSLSNPSGAKLNLKEKFHTFKQVVTVEPLLACYIFALGLCRPATDNLELEKSCRVNLQLNTTICDAILTGNHRNFTKENRLVQVEISNVRSWQQPLQSVMPLVLVLFLGSFSDRHKCRKPFLLLPIVGQIVSVVGCILSVVFMEETSLEVLGVAQKIVPSLFGGQTMLMMASISYIADISSVEMRTLRVGTTQIVISVFSLLVQPISGLLLYQFGYIGILAAAGLLYALGMCYGCFWINEPKTDTKPPENLVKNVFDPRHAVDTLKLLFKRNPEKNHAHIVLVLLTIVIYKCALLGESGVLFLYTQSVFHWTPVEFGYFLATNSLTNLIGTTIAITLFTKIFKLDDLFILLLTVLDRIAANIVFGMARTPLVLYIGVVVNIIAGLTKVTIRSLATKIVSKDDLGKAQSLFGICEAIVPSMAVPLYHKLVYVNTIETFPSAFFFFSIILYTVCFFVLLFMYAADRRNSKDDELRSSNS